MCDSSRARAHRLPRLCSQASDIEACVVRNDNLKFTRLSPDELEAQLTALAERDDDIAGRD